jgi:hypothetical protein
MNGELIMMIRKVEKVQEHHKDEPGEEVSVTLKIQ